MHMKVNQKIKHYTVPKNEIVTTQLFLSNRVSELSSKFTTTKVPKAFKATELKIISSFRLVIIQILKYRPQLSIASVYIYQVTYYLKGGFIGSTSKR